MSKPDYISVVAAIGVAAVLAGATPSLAERLDKPACDALKSEEEGLVQAGIKADMEKGPEWAKANLGAERLTQIARYIELGEQIAFRCREIKAPAPSKTAKPAGKPDANKAAAASAADTVAPAPGAKPAVKKPKPDTQTTSAVEPGAEKPPAVIRVKPAAKPAARPAKKSTTSVKKPVQQQKPGLFSVE